jgi:hypothetical protein
VGEFLAMALPALSQHRNSARSCSNSVRIFAIACTKALNKAGSCQQSCHSVAASQAEPTFSADYVFVTATGLLLSTRRWVEHFDFKWVCY